MYDLRFPEGVHSICSLQCKSSLFIQEVNVMAKSHNSKKNTKTPPQKTAKEKRKEKREKKNK